MADILLAFISEVDKIRKRLPNKHGHQLQSQKEKLSIRSLAGKYFNDIRPSFVSKDIQTDSIQSVDALFQEIVTLSHKNCMSTKYREILLSIKNCLISLDSSSISASTQSLSSFEDIDNSIIQTLNSLLPSAAASYMQALCDLQQENRYSWRGPATDLRESLREVLDHLAPDEEVIKISGYKQEANTNGPTMKQKVRFILSNRGKSKSAIEPAERAVETVEESLGSFVRSVYTRSSVSTHTPTDKREISMLVDLLRVVFKELLVL